MTKQINFGGIMSLVSLFIFTILGCDGEKNKISTSQHEFKEVSTFINVLQENPDGVLANRNREKIRTQIITFQFLDGNKVYFGTNSEKPLYKQLLDYPNVSYCTFPNDFEPVLSLNGKVVFVEDRALKVRALNEGEYLRRHYKSPDDPKLKLFYIDVEEIETFGNDGAKIYSAK
jgi:uncharacterized pyridoxamine 5'-phosphate oxidase family protein